MDQRTLTRTERRLLMLAAGLLAFAVSLCLRAPAAAAAAAASVPSPTTHRVGALCGEPSPGHSGCLGLRLVSDEPLAERNERKSPVAGSLSPASVLTAYGLNGLTPPSTQTIALVDAYDDATAEADLATFDSHYGLPACTQANGCFRKVNQEGEAAPLPASSGPVERGWAQEIATDVEVAHGVCQSCRILLVEANSNNNEDLYAAEQTAVALHATEISNSWGGEEPGFDSPAFNHPGVVITASSGDEGYLDWLTGESSAAAQYPASSPHVIGVGGTRLQLNPETGARKDETVWNDGGFNGVSFEGSGAGGGGCSARFAATSWQQGVPDWPSVGCGGKRAVADVSADADPYTGVAVYDSTKPPEGEKGWAMIGGTSVASPIVASVFALAGGAHGVAYPSHTLYENLAADPSSLHDVVSGSNGECAKQPSEKTGESTCSAAVEAATSCEGHAICLAGPGYDGPSGVGTPAGVDAFKPLSEHGSSGFVEPSEAPGPVQAPGTSSPGTSAPAAPAPNTATTPSGSSATARPAIGALRLTARACGDGAPARAAVADRVHVPAERRGARARDGHRARALARAQPLADGLRAARVPRAQRHALARAQRAQDARAGALPADARAGGRRREDDLVHGPLAAAAAAVGDFAGALSALVLTPARG